VLLEAWDEPPQAAAAITNIIANIPTERIRSC